jgi:hypothetical protein
VGIHHLSPGLLLLVISRTWASLLNPVRLVKSLIVFTFSLESLRFFAIQFVVGALLYFELQIFFEVSGWHVFWAVPMTLVMLFILFRALGVLLNSQGERLGIPIMTNAKSHQTALTESKRLELANFVAKVHRHARVHNYKQAWAQVEDHLQTTDFANIDSLFERLSEWEDKKIATRLRSVLIERLMETGDFDRACRVFTECHTMSGGDVRLPSGSAVLLLMEPRQRCHAPKTPVRDATEF